MFYPLCYVQYVYWLWVEVVGKAAQPHVTVRPMLPAAVRGANTCINLPVKLKTRVTTSGSQHIYIVRSLIVLVANTSTAACRRHYGCFATTKTPLHHQSISEKKGHNG